MLTVDIIHVSLTVWVPVTVPLKYAPWPLGYWDIPLWLTG